MDSRDNKKNNQPALIKKLVNFALDKLGFMRRRDFSLDWRRLSRNETKKQLDLDKMLVYSLSKSRIPNFTQLKYIGNYLSRTELWVIRISLAIAVISLGVIAVNYYRTHLSVVPKIGGEYAEAVIGSIEYINPLYANLSDADSDISYLLYSSLFKRDKDGQLAKDLAKEYAVSPEGKSFTLTVRTDARWTTGDPLTVDDIVFTFNAIKNPAYKSTLRTGLTGVEVEKISNNQLKFNLSEPYAAFLELLTFGIIPQSQWQDIPPETARLAELNLKPIGSGPFKFDKYIKGKNGQILEYYLTRNDDYYSQPPYLEKMIIKLFSNFDEIMAAWGKDVVQGISYLPKDLKAGLSNSSSYNIYNLDLPQLDIIFFNARANTALSDKGVRQALSFAVDKNQLLTEALGGEARLVNSPILPNSFAYNGSINKYKFDQAEASKLLEQYGWKVISVSKEEYDQALLDIGSDDKAKQAKAAKISALGPGQWREKNGEYLTVRLSTVERGENEAIVRFVKNNWEAIGVKTDVQVVSPAQIQQEVLRPRNFEALFYGVVVGADPDVYALWHSTQAASGLNLAGYSNKEADQLLEDARLSNDQNLRKEKYFRFQEIIAEDAPAIFLFTPVYNYLQNKKVRGFNVKSINIPRDRFSNISEWYLETKKTILTPWGEF